MRRGKRVKVVRMPTSDPVKKVYTIPRGIPVEIPVRKEAPIEIPNTPERKQHAS